MPKISVIVPVYKVEPYLNRCIDSILNQTYTDLEVILVDDGSPDNCPALCDQAAQRDPRIKVIHKENGGAASARNAGLAAATGEYIGFVDSDDYIDAEMYQILMETAVDTGADIVECGYRWVKPNVLYDRENTRAVDLYTNVEALEKLYFGDQMFGGISIVVWNKLYRRALFDEIHFTEGFICEDVEITPKLLYSARLIAKYNYNFYNFFFSPNSVSRSSYSLKHYHALKVRKYIVDFFGEVALERYRQYTEALYIGALYSNYCECYARRKDAEYRDAARSIVREAKEYFQHILKNPYTTAWRVYLFRLFPQGYYAVARVYRWAKAKRQK